MVREGAVAFRIAKNAVGGDTRGLGNDGVAPSVAEMSIDYREDVRAARKDRERAVWRWFVDGG